MTDKERAIINTFNYLYDHTILCPQCGKYMILPIYKCFGCGCDIDVYREEQDNARLEAYHKQCPCWNSHNNSCYDDNCPCDRDCEYMKNYDKNNDYGNTDLHK